jgi:hypothetical protein
LHHRTGEPLSNGVSVCADPACTLTFAFAAWDDERVDAWVAEQAPRLRHSGLCLGGWLDERDAAWLDVVRVFPAHDQRGAIALGTRLAQHAVFDLDRRTVVTIDAR